MATRILLVDDEPNNLYLLEKMLKPYGLIFSATSGEEGFEMFQKAHQAKKPFDVLFLDIVMLDGIQGDEVQRRIREWESFYLQLDDPVISIVIASTVRKREMIEQMIEEGGQFYMNKPYRIENIVKIMDALGIEVKH